MTPLFTRERWFCAYCGQMTTYAADDDGRARCAQHRGLELDPLPDDEVGSLAVDAGLELEDAQTRKGGRLAR